MMKRDNVDHILRAAGNATGQQKFVLIGSAAVVAWHAMLPDELVISRDVDLFAYDAPDPEAIADELDGSLGQASQFDSEFGYYCDGVSPTTAILPLDWEDRALEYRSSATGGVTALAPHPDDIALAKLCAWRPKDIEWLRAAARHFVIDPKIMLARLDKMPPRAGSSE